MNTKEHLKSILASLNILYLLVEDHKIDISSVTTELYEIIKETFLAAHNSFNDNELNDDIKSLYKVLISNQHKFEKAFPGLSHEIMTALKNNVDIQG